MKTINRSLACAVLVAAAGISTGAAQAETQTLSVKDNGFSYKYVEGVFFQQDFDGNFDVDGLGVRVASELDEHLFIRGEVGLFDGDADGGLASPDVDGFQLGGGLGFHSPLQDRLDLVLAGDIFYVDYDVDNVGGDDELGFRLTGGVRYQADEKIELSGGMFLEDIFDSELGVYGQGLVEASEALQVGAGLRLSSDLEELNLMVRYNF